MEIFEIYRCSRPVRHIRKSHLEEIFNRIKKITDRGNIGISDYIREEMGPEAVFEVDERSRSKANALKRKDDFLLAKKRREPPMPSCLLLESIIQVPVYMGDNHHEDPMILFSLTSSRIDSIRASQHLVD